MYYTISKLPIIGNIYIREGGLIGVVNEYIYVVQNFN